MSDDGQVHKPTLRPYFHIIPMEGERVQLRSARKIMLLRGKLASTLIPQLLPYLDGHHPTEEIVAKLSGFSEKDVRGALDLLSQRGLLEEGNLTPPPDFGPDESARLDQQMLFFGELEGDQFASQRKLKQGRVVVWAAEGLCVPLVSTLADSGIGQVSVVSPVSGELSGPAVQHASREIHSADDAREVMTGANLAIVATSGPAPTLLSYFNEAALQTDVPLLPAQLNGTEAIVGPTIYPRQTACYTCYELRSRANEPFYDEYLAYEEYLDRTPHQRRIGALRSSCGLVANVVAWEAVRVLTEFTLPGLAGSILIVNLLTLETSTQKVFKLPRCPVCSRVGPRSKIWQKEANA
jgi:bacteriocin biosynthesis cyclodehydratase domain-containing protein